MITSIVSIIRIIIIITMTIMIIPVLLIILMIIMDYGGPSALLTTYTPAAGDFCLRALGVVTAKVCRPSYVFGEIDYTCLDHHLPIVWGLCAVTQGIHHCMRMIGQAALWAGAGSDHRVHTHTQNTLMAPSTPPPPPPPHPLPPPSTPSPPPRCLRIPLENTCLLPASIPKP